MLFLPLYTYFALYSQGPFHVLFDSSRQFECVDGFFPTEVIRMFERVSQAEEYLLIKGFCFHLQRADLKSLLPMVQTALNWESSLQEAKKPFVMQRFLLHRAQGTRSTQHLHDSTQRMEVTWALTTLKCYVNSWNQTTQESDIFPAALIL